MAYHLLVKFRSGPLTLVALQAQSRITVRVPPTTADRTKIPWLESHVLPDQTKRYPTGSLAFWWGLIAGYVLLCAGLLTVKIAIATTPTMKTLEERKLRYLGLGLPAPNRWEISIRESRALFECMSCAQKV